MKNKDKFSSLYFWSAIILTALGAVLRLLMYVQSRSLFMDEAGLSNQIIARDYSGLFSNLDFQYAPPFFSVTVKAMTQLFGANEYALRCIPLIASLFSLILFYKLCRKFLRNQYSLFPLFLFCFGMPIVRFATEVKQYSSDIFFSLLILHIALRWKVKELNFKSALFIGVLGAIIIWCSMSSVFILFGLGLYYFYEIIKNKQSSKLKFLAISIASWLFSFGHYYFSILHQDIKLEGLQDFHAKYFLPLAPSNLAELKRFANILLSFYQTSIGATGIAVIVGILSTIIAFVYLFKNQRGLTILFSSPFLITLIASGFGFYSLIPRLTLFLMPILILLIGIGFSQLVNYFNPKVRLIFFLPMLIILFNQNGFQYLYKPFKYVEFRETLQYISINKMKGDGTYLHHKSELTFDFYTNWHQNSEKSNFENVLLGHWSIPIQQTKLPETNRVWLILSHIPKEEVNLYINRFKEEYEVLDQDFKTLSYAILLRKKE